MHPAYLSYTTTLKHASFEKETNHEMQDKTLQPQENSLKSLDL